MSYQDDKRELLKLKQGIIEESETIKEEEKPNYELHGWKKVSNFLYHYKWRIVLAVFFTAVIAFFLYDALSSDVGDVRVLTVAKSHEVSANIQFKTQDFERALEQFCPDFDDNGYSHVDVYNIDLSESVYQDYMLGAVTKLTGEITYAEAQMYIMDTPALESIVPDGDMSIFVNLEERYPGCEQVDGYFYYIKGSHLEYLANYVEACPDDLFIVVRSLEGQTANRSRAEKMQPRALQLMDSIVNADYEGWLFEEGRIYFNN